MRSLLQKILTCACGWMNNLGDGQNSYILLHKWRVLSSYENQIVKKWKMMLLHIFPKHPFYDKSFLCCVVFMITSDSHCWHIFVVWKIKYRKYLWSKATIDDHFLWILNKRIVLGKALSVIWLLSQNEAFSLFIFVWVQKYAKQ